MIPPRSGVNSSDDRNESPTVTDLPEGTALIFLPHLLTTNLRMRIWRSGSNEGMIKNQSVRGDIQGGGGNYLQKQKDILSRHRTISTWFYTETSTFAAEVKILTTRDHSK